MWTDCFFTAESEEIGFFTAESEDILFLQCQFNRLFLCCRKWTDCFFTAESEEIVSSLQKVNRLFLYCGKWTDCFFTTESEDDVLFLQSNLTDYFFAAESDEIGFFTVESEDILFLQCQFNRLFLLFAKWAESEQKDVTCRGTESNDKFDAFNTYYIQTIVLDIINMVDCYAVKRTNINIILFILRVDSKDVHLEWSFVCLIQMKWKYKM